LAPQAAGAIHSDFERGFIKAELCAYDDFKEHCGGKASMARFGAEIKFRGRLGSPVDSNAGEPQEPGQVPPGGQELRREGRRHHRVQIQCF
jgi:hypothetical protein